MIEFKRGNLFDSDAQIICHQCNCQGVMGAGVAKQVKDRYPAVFASYYDDYKKGRLRVGYVNFAPTGNESGQIIANLCGQDRYGRSGVFTDYDGLKSCFSAVREFAVSKYVIKPKIALPYKMGSDRGGGDWDTVLSIIEDKLSDFDVEIWQL